MSAFDLGADVGSDSAPMWILWLADDADGRCLCEASLEEVRPDLGEYHLNFSRIVARLGPTASEVLCPWTNYPRVSALPHWRVVRDQASLLAYTPFAREPLSATLESPAAALLGPALQTERGELDVFVASAARDTVTLLRFETPTDDIPAPPVRALFRVPLPAPLSRGRCALGPSMLGSPRAVVTTSATASELRIHLVHVTPDGVPAPAATAVFPGLRELAPPALTIDSLGAARVAVIAAAGAAERPELWLAEAVFPAGGAAPTDLRTTPLASLLGAPLAAAVAPDIGASRRPFPAWAALLEGGGALVSGRSTRPLLPPTIPLTLVSRGAATHALVFDSVGGPALILL